MSLGPLLAIPVWIGTLLISLLALAGVARRRRGAAPLAVVALVLWVTTAPVTGEMRLGIPLQAVLAVLAACAVVRAARPGGYGAKNGVDT